MKERSGHFWKRIVEGKFTARDFWDNFRVNKATFDFLCGELAPAIHRQNTQWRKAVCVRKRVAITLWRLSTNCEYRTIRHLFGVARCTANDIVKDTCLVIVQELMRRYINFPSGDRLRATVQGFEDMGFPQVAGTIEGTHIPIIAPVNYHNRKGWYSIILQAVCDNTYMFTDIMVGRMARTSLIFSKPSEPRFPLSHEYSLRRVGKVLILLKIRQGNCEFFYVAYPKAKKSSSPKFGSLCNNEHLSGKNTQC